MTRRAVTLGVCVVLAVVLAVVGLTLHVPYVQFAPGPVTDTLGSNGNGKQLIQIDGHPTYPTTGTLDLVTVSVSGGPGYPLTLGDALRGWLSSTLAVVPESIVYPPGQTSQQVEQENAAEMQQSQEDATAAALSELHIPFKTDVTVAAVSPKGPSDGKLKAGDVITAVAGTPVTSEQQLRDAITSHQVGQTISLDITRNGAPQTVQITLGQQSGRPIIGVIPGESHQFPFHIDIALRDVGGPSAGMMFALGIIDKLTPGSLTGGRRVAGTGTIDDSGTVGEIGGIEQKVVGARRAGATIFLTPAGNCAAAAANRPSGLTLVTVHTLADALAALDDIRAGKTPPLCR